MLGVNLCFEMGYVWGRGVWGGGGNEAMQRPRKLPLLLLDAGAFFIPVVGLSEVTGGRVAEDSQGGHSVGDGVGETAKGFRG